MRDSLKKVKNDSFLGKCLDTDMCIHVETDLFENIYMKTDEKGVIPTSSAVLRDILYIIEQNNKISKL